MYMNLVEFTPIHQCGICKEKDALYAKIKQRGIGFIPLSEFESNPEELNKLEIEYIRCIKCKAESEIVWEDHTRNPRQLIDTYDADIFISRWNKK